MEDVFMVTNLVSFLGHISLPVYFLVMLTILAIFICIHRNKILQKICNLPTIITLVMAGIVITLLGKGIYQFFNNNQITVTKDIMHQESSVLAEKKNVTIQNLIEQDMLKYKHWTGTYEPTTFVLSINDKEITSGSKEMVTIVDNILSVRFDYAFLNGKRNGAKIISFEVEENVKDLNITFNWKGKWQVLIDNAIPIEKNKVKFNKALLE